MARKTESIEDKATRYLAEGRVVVVEVSRDPHLAHVLSATVLVQGGGDEPYKVTSDGWGWVCTCPAYVLRCAHIVAGQKITGWEPREGGPSLRLPSDLDWVFAPTA